MNDDRHAGQARRQDRRHQHRAVGHDRADVSPADDCCKAHGVGRGARDLQRPALGRRAPDRNARGRAHECAQRGEAWSQLTVADGDDKGVVMTQRLRLAEPDQLRPGGLGAVNRHEQGHPRRADGHAGGLVHRCRER